MDARLLARVRSEFREMPGLALTLAQAMRLFALSPDECRAVLDQLVREGFLSHGLTGRYGRRAVPR